MNIMEIVSGVAVNGAIRHCLLLTRELVRRGHRLTVLCWPGSWIARQLADEPVEVIESDLHRWPTGELRRVAALVRERDIEVMHTHLSRAHFFGVLLRWMTGVPSVATAHSRHFQLHWMFNDLVIAASEATRHYHCQWNLVNQRRITTIHNFVDPRQLEEVPGETRARMRASLGADDSWNVLGTIGSVIPRKGMIHLIRALPRIVAAAPRTRLVAVGESGPPEYMALLKSTVLELNLGEYVLWLGNRADVHELIAAMDVCVLPSLEETLPLAILEAMAGGLPVVATAVGGVPECVQGHQTGLLVPPANSDALADAIVSLLTEPQERRRLGAAARRAVRERFSPAGQTAQIEAALKSVIRPRRARAA